MLIRHERRIWEEMERREETLGRRRRARR
jgi:hypothetical protein